MNLKMGGILKFEQLSSYIIVEAGARKILPDFCACQQKKGE
jgi:hypothetical protein